MLTYKDAVQLIQQEISILTREHDAEFLLSSVRKDIVLNYLLSKHPPLGFSLNAFLQSMRDRLGNRNELVDVHDYSFKTTLDETKQWLRTLPCCSEAFRPNITFEKKYKTAIAEFFTDHAKQEALNKYLDFIEKEFIRGSPTLQVFLAILHYVLDDKTRGKVSLFVQALDDSRLAYEMDAKKYWGDNEDYSCMIGLEERLVLFFSACRDHQPAEISYQDRYNLHLFDRIFVPTAHGLELSDEVYSCYLEASARVKVRHNIAEKQVEMIESIDTKTKSFEQRLNELADQEVMLLRGDFEKLKEMERMKEVHGNVRKRPHEDTKDAVYLNLLEMRRQETKLIDFLQKDESDNVLRPYRLQGAHTLTKVTKARIKRILSRFCDQELTAQQLENKYYKKFSKFFIKKTVSDRSWVSEHQEEIAQTLQSIMGISKQYKDVIEVVAAKTAENHEAVFIAILEQNISSGRKMRMDYHQATDNIRRALKQLEGFGIACINQGIYLPHMVYSLALGQSLLKYHAGHFEKLISSEELLVQSIKTNPRFLLRDSMAQNIALICCMEGLPDALNALFDSRYVPNLDEKYSYEDDDSSVVVNLLDLAIIQSRMSVIKILAERNYPNSFGELNFMYSKYFFSVLAYGDIPLLEYFIASSTHTSDKKFKNRLYEGLAHIIEDRDIHSEQKIEIVDHLLSHGLDINHRYCHDHRNPTKRNNTLLIKAVRAQEEGLVHKILMHPDRVNIDAQNGDGKTALIEAARLGNLEITEMLISYPAGLNFQDRSGTTALIRAISSGCVDVIEIILARKPDLTLQDKSGRTALHYVLACEYLSPVNKAKLASVLLDAGANPFATDSKKNTPLLLAIKQQSQRIVEQILSGLESGEHGGLNYVNRSGDTALNQAIKCQHIDLIEMLLDAGASLIYPEHNPPMLLAVEIGSQPIVRLLVENGGDINQQRYDGLTGLHSAVMNKQNDMVKFLIQEMKVKLLPNSTGETALMLAISAGHHEVIPTLLKCQGLDINHANKKGETALIIACQMGYSAVIEKLLRVKGIDVEKQDLDGSKAIEYLLEGEDEKAIGLIQDFVSSEAPRRELVLSSSSVGHPQALVLSRSGVVQFSCSDPKELGTIPSHRLGRK